MNEFNKMELKLKSNELIMLWRQFCETHTQLYEFTCDEYMHLLSSEIDDLNATVEKKLKVLDVINELDAQRQQLTSEILILMDKTDNKKLSTLLEALKEQGEDGVAMQVDKLNSLLIDVIEKIQEQNKKNQVFLNKAILSLQELRENFTGKTNYKTYSSMGTTRSNNTL